jgi:hypothetical protein
MVLPIFGLMAMATTLGAAAMNAGAAAAAPRPPGEKDIRKRYDSRIGQATDAAQKSGMASSLSLARSGSGTGGSRAAALRAAMMQAPEIQARATESGFNAGSNTANSEIVNQQNAYGQATERYQRPFQEVTQGLGAMATGFTDMGNAQMMTQAADKQFERDKEIAQIYANSGYGGNQRYAQSDERSKQRIAELESENAALNASFNVLRRAQEGRAVPSGQSPTGTAATAAATGALSGGVTAAGMQRQQPEIIDLDAIPDTQPADPRAAARAMAIQKDQTRQAPQPQAEYGSDAYFLSKYDPDILEFNQQQAAAAAPKAPAQKRAAKKKGTK